MGRLRDGTHTPIAGAIKSTYLETEVPQIARRSLD